VRKVVVVILLSMLVLFFFQAYCIAHEEPPEPPPQEEEEGIQPSDTTETTVTDVEQEDDNGYEIRHNLVRWLAYLLLALIVLTVASGFWKGKRIYRRVHHALAYTTLVVALTHGILGLTL